MKSATKAAIATLLCAQCQADGGSPIGKVIAMIDDLYSKVVSEGATGQKEYDEFREWCEERSANLGFEIKTGKAEVESLTAKIGSLAAKSKGLETKLEEYATSMAAEQDDLKDARSVRAAEAGDFSSSEHELQETIDTLTRAIGILSKKGASMVQLRHADSLAQVFSALVDASTLNVQDSQKLLALVQNDQTDDGTSLGAPSAAVYEGQSGDIVSTLADLRDKAESQLAEVRKKETNAVHKFEMLEQGLQDSLAVTAADTASAKKTLAETAESKAVTSGDLEVTSKDLAEDVDVLATAHGKCLAKTEAFEAAVKSRSEELSALQKAKEVILEATGAGASFLQLSSSPQFAAARFVRDLARREKSVELAQLATRIVSVRSGDIFAKVKTLIGQMIERLEDEAGSDATEKAFCDKQLAETTGKKEKREATVGKLTTKIDQAAARSAKLKQEIAALGQQLSDLASSQAAMTKMRGEEKETFVANEAETAKGLEGIKLALAILRDYYAKAASHDASTGAAGGIVSLLEVCESDFTKSLAEMRATEEAAAADYETQTKQNALSKTTKSKDLEYKTKESTGLDKAASEMTSDRDGVQTELDALNEYLEKLNERCTEKAESYADRTAARKAEIEGLREALQILAAPEFLEIKHSLRGVRAH